MLCGLAAWRDFGRPQPGPIWVRGCSGEAPGIPENRTVFPRTVFGEDAYNQRQETAAVSHDVVRDVACREALLRRGRESGEVARASLRLTEMG